MARNNCEFAMLYHGSTVICNATLSKILTLADMVSIFALSSQHFDDEQLQQRRETMLASGC
jgi:hypothetical protein